MRSQLLEINIDGLIGPSHHFGGLGVGNLASQSNQYRQSNPKAAALEGLTKMRLLWRLGIPQYYLPPPTRPNWWFLKTLGYERDAADLLKRCESHSPILLSAAYSSAFMWTANAATVAPACDTLDGRLHVVPANLCCNLHRGQEASERYEQLQAMFSHVPNTSVQSPLPSVFPLRDEGAANHMRLSCTDGIHAVHLFVHGNDNKTNSKGFISRQSELASRQVATKLNLAGSNCIFAEQSKEAIDAGVFHNDVIAMSHRNVLIYHEKAFVEQDQTPTQIAERFKNRTGADLISIRVAENELALEHAVETYLFNSQLVSTENNEMHLICPSQCQSSPAASRLVQSWMDDASNPIQQVHYLALDQSMRNGGGPACLRLRVPLLESQSKSLGDRFRITEERLDKLYSAIERWYPEKVSTSDFARLDFAEHCQQTSIEIQSLSQ